jgi:hypothetical protein
VKTAPSLPPPRLVKSAKPAAPATSPAEAPAVGAAPPPEAEVVLVPPPAPPPAFVPEPVVVTSAPVAAPVAHVEPEPVAAEEAAQARRRTRGDRETGTCRASTGTAGCGQRTSGARRRGAANSPGASPGRTDPCDTRVAPSGRRPNRCGGANRTCRAANDSTPGRGPQDGAGSACRPAPADPRPSTGATAAGGGNREPEQARTRRGGTAGGRSWCRSACTAAAAPCPGSGSASADGRTAATALAARSSTNAAAARPDSRISSAAAAAIRPAACGPGRSPRSLTTSTDSDCAVRTAAGDADHYARRGYDRR